MKTKLAYVLISNEDDLYVEMTLLSVVSARMHNPDACIVLVADQTTLDSCQQGLRKEFLSYFSEVVCVDTSRYDNAVKRSRHIKTSLREHISGDYLYIDSDTVVCGDLSAIDNTPGDIAMARDMHFSRATLMYLWGDVFARLGHDLNTPQFYNAGVLYAKDTPAAHNLYKTWHEKWMEAQAGGVNVDQPPLMKSLKESDVTFTELSGIWNCQLSGAFMPYLADALILHFHTGSPSGYYHKLADTALLRRIKDQGLIDEATARLLAHAKSAFNDDFTLIGARETPHISTDLYRRMKLYHDKAPALFNALARVSSLLLYVYGFMERHSMLKRK